MSRALFLADVSCRLRYIGTIWQFGACEDFRQNSIVPSSPRILVASDVTIFVKGPGLPGKRLSGVSSEYVFLHRTV